MKTFNTGQALYGLLVRSRHAEPSNKRHTGPGRSASLVAVAVRSSNRLDPRRPPDYETRIVGPLSVRRTTADRRTRPYLQPSSPFRDIYRPTFALSHVAADETTVVLVVRRCQREHCGPVVSLRYTFPTSGRYNNNN